LGGNGDIGSAIVTKFQNEGCQVIAPTSKELNLEDRDAVESYLQSHSFDVDVIIQCAGRNNPKTLPEMTYEDIDKTNDINVISFYRIIQHFASGMRQKKDGYILGISSIYGSYSRKGRLAYAMSKHALNALIKTLALELGPDNIKVNCLSPGFVDTKLTRKNNSPETIRNLVEKIPLGRMASVEDIANIAYFLCSRENNFINGQNIIADGGYSVGGFQN
jgi:3-oxoacyl-[acyl-carrier protein] reductase